MVLSYVLVAVLSIAVYEAFRSIFMGSGSESAEQFARAAIVIVGLIAAVPVGAFLGAATVSALVESLLVGMVVLSGSVLVVAAIGFGLYLVAEGEFPAALRERSRPN